ncbi:hypothetical protein BAUCODRAFT_33673 [Baudoinia panamericana UAMH 10762]|uniref:LYR motif-containing protein Cup1-like N-terminal domain-containing protein n=1 Tax=Baudoinia panamericana (strain UAMH 10762) TaxID=717646 RepID=M2LPL5_BAUPA|nr:uncharacterized protein BAUCODRAFT_33673 [Baudoinia panamericana UAMH 10762]EMC96342.1 hypothetical protein BAUCODRAFT_33673 [Baudoinia panamericana UAMH 10762]
MQRWRATSPLHGTARCLARSAGASRPLFATGFLCKEASVIDSVSTKQRHAPAQYPGSLESDQARHLVRALLRECSYLPDSQARKWIKGHVIDRFRSYSFKTWKHRNDPAYGERLRQKLEEARHAASVLRRANEGERKPLLKVLLVAYGRTGKRRHELMKPLMPVSAPLEQGQSISLNTNGSNSTSEQSAGAKRTTQSPMTRKPSAREVNQGQWTAYVPDFTPQLRAVLQSQIRHPPPHLTRPILRKMAPQLEELNSWMRPMPLSRVKNQVEKWYAELLDKVHPPLPVPEWERLRDLASGQQTERFIPRRTFAGLKKPSALELVVVFNQAGVRKVFENREAHSIEPRYIRRLWFQVFLQCPAMEWDTQKAEWSVIWGQQALSAVNNAPKDKLPTVCCPNTACGAEYLKPVSAE